MKRSWQPAPRWSRLGLSLSMALLTACGSGGGGAVRTEPPPPSGPPPVPPPPPPPPPPPNTPQPAFDAHLTLTNARSAQALGLTGAGVRIGVVDSGVRRDHPALAGRVGPHFLYTDPRSNDFTVDDKLGHGTYVSQIAGGKPFGLWPGGIAPDALFVSARIISDTPPSDDGTGQGNRVDGAGGLDVVHRDLINAGVRVMNNSWGGLYWDTDAATRSFIEAYRPFIMSWGGLVVFSTGNEGRAQPSDTASLPSQGLDASVLERGWIAVAALDTNTPTRLASYSNACGVAMNYCLVAPGNVIATGPTDTLGNPSYWVIRGTSFSAPQVSGAAALVWQAFPYFNNDLVRQTLLGTATDLGDPGVDAVFGRGLLNIGAAVRGPSRLDWGDVRVSFDAARSVWSNNLSGTGGLIKDGVGTLELAAAASASDYSGDTRVQGGTLQVERSLTQSAVFIGPNGRLAGRGSISRRVTNDGVLAVGGTGRLSVGDYTHNAGARLDLELGWEGLNVARTATLNGGDVRVTGVKSGYVTQARERVLHADGGVQGTFSTLSSAPNVFLTGTLAYDPSNVWLDIQRLNVTTAARDLGVQSAASLAAAARVESAFQALDRNAGGRPGDFGAAAAAFQNTPDAAAAQRSLASLSGELHGADTAFATMAIEGNRHALESRLDAQAQRPVDGAWADRLDLQRVAGGRFDMDGDGWIIGHDRRLRPNLSVGMALGQSDGYAHHEQRRDRERNRQFQGQLYSAWNQNGHYLFGQVAFGRMERRLQRDILLGDYDFNVDSDYANRYLTLGLQAGHRFTFANGTVTPYVGAQALQLDRDGFSEPGAAGFGLSARSSSLSARQWLVGARMEREWRMGATVAVLSGRAEWQRAWSQSGGDIQARFTALDVWSPIVGGTLSPETGVLGIGLSLHSPRAGVFSMDLDGRHEFGRSYARAFARWTFGF